jgi:pilus assembly protein CpaB
MLLAIATKPIDTNTTFTVGADVSRYQRSTVPSKTSSDNGGNKGASGAVTPSGEAVSRPTGPTVRIARGNNVTVVPVGAK